MTDPIPPTFLQQELELRRRDPSRSTRLSEVGAIALDMSVMVGTMVEVLALLHRAPAMADSPDGETIRSLIDRLKARWELHVTVLDEINRAR